MVLADTSVWIDHFRSHVPSLGELLAAGEMVMHPFVLGELLLSGLKGDAITNLRALPQPIVATVDDVAALIEAHPLHGRGIGYVDSALLASARLEPGMKLWTHDRRLARIAAELSVDFTRRG